MKRPTHVMVGAPLDCRLCKGTGKRPPGHLSFARVVNELGEELCPECRGAKLAGEWVTLEDFAKLFTWGRVIDLTLDGRQTGERRIIFPAAPENEGTAQEGSNGQ